MSGSFLGFILEVIVAALLLATIAYCVIVNRKLEKLRADQENLKSIIRDLNQSTLHAEAAAGELRTTVEKASKELAVQINRAENSTVNLRNHNDKAEGLLSRLDALDKADREKDEDRPAPGLFSPRNGFPLEGAAVREDVPDNQAGQSDHESPWPQLKLSSLSTHGMPEPEQNVSPPESDRPLRRSRFQWES